MGTLFDGDQEFTPNFEFAVARGEIPNTTYQHKFGANLAVGATFETVWTGSAVFTYLAAASALNITSTSTDDVMTSGTGAWTVNILGVDGDYNEINETVELNGQTSVATTKTFLRVYRMKVLTAGTGLTNAGIIYAGTGTNTTGTPANKYGAIAAGYAQTLMALYTVPLEYTAFLSRFAVSSAVSKAVTARLMVKEFGSVFQVKDLINLTVGQVVSEWEYPLVVPAKSDIEVQAFATGAGGSVAATFTMLLVKE